MTIATDLCIAVSLCYLLYKLRNMAMRRYVAQYFPGVSKSQLATQRTHSMVNYIMVYVINTGLLTTYALHPYLLRLETKASCQLCLHRYPRFGECRKCSC